MKDLNIHAKLDCESDKSEYQCHMEWLRSLLIQMQEVGIDDKYGDHTSADLAREINWLTDRIEIAKRETEFFRTTNTEDYREKNIYDKKERHVASLIDDLVACICYPNDSLYPNIKTITSEFEKIFNEGFEIASLEDGKTVIPSKEKLKADVKGMCRWFPMDEKTKDIVVDLINNAEWAISTDGKKRIYPSVNLRTVLWTIGDLYNKHITYSKDVKIEDGDELKKMLENITDKQAKEIAQILLKNVQIRQQGFFTIPIVPLMTVLTLLSFKGKQGIDNIKDAYLEFMKTEYNCDVKQFI